MLRGSPLRSLAILAIALCGSGCISGRILTTPGDYRSLELGASGRSVGVRGVPRAATSKYQGTFENEVVRALRQSGMFTRVLHEKFQPEEVDLELRIGPATLWYDRRPHPLYFPLALATLTLYVWVGGPVFSDYQQFDVTLSAFSSQGQALFELHHGDWYHHGVNLYHDEYGDTLCHGPDAERFVGELLDRLNATFAGAAAP